MDYSSLDNYPIYAANISSNGSGGFDGYYYQLFNNVTFSNIERSKSPVQFLTTLFAQVTSIEAFQGSLKTGSGNDNINFSQAKNNNNINTGSGNDNH